MPKMSWTRASDRERLAVLHDPGNVGNYKAMRVWPAQVGGWAYSVNGQTRGRKPTIADAKYAAIEFAKAQIEGRL